MSSGHMFQQKKNTSEVEGSANEDIDIILRLPNPLVKLPSPLMATLPPAPPLDNSLAAGTLQGESRN